MKLYHGAAFYPELWNKEVILEDIRKMKEIGINIVRIGEFWWSVIEPSEGSLELDFVQEILDLLYQNNIDVVLCTPTATPPIWLTHNNIEILHINENNERMIHGSRQHACTNNLLFRKKSELIVKSIAEKFGNHPSIVLWQIDNELKCHISECFCDSCKAQWHSWLEEKYRTIEKLNKKWGTNIWSESYQSFDQIPQPLKTTPFIHHASLNTMYKLFHREKIVEFANMQKDIIKSFSNAPVTTNTGLGFTLNNELLFSELDCVGFDTYASHEHFHAFILNCDLWRNIKRNKEYWLLETSCSFTGALDRHAVPHPPKYLAAEAVASYALGGKAFLYWLWRQQPYGSELSHSAVLNAWGTPSIGYQDVLLVEEARKRIETIILDTTCCQGDIAITYSDISKAFFETESHKKNSYRNLVTDLQEIMLETGFHRDWIPELIDLDGYKLLVAPFIYHLTESYINKAETFVKNGGIWIVGPMTNLRSEHHTAYIDSGIGKKLEELAGVETLYFSPLENSGASGEAFGMTAPLKLYSSIFNPVNSNMIGKIKNSNADGKAFLTERKVGKGKIVMLGSLPYEETGKEMLKKIIINYAQEAKIKKEINGNSGIVIIPRADNNGKYYFLVNMKNFDNSFNVCEEFFDVLNKKLLPKGKHILKAFNYIVLQKEN